MTGVTKQQVTHQLPPQLPAHMCEALQFSMWQSTSCPFFSLMELVKVHFAFFVSKPGTLIILILRGGLTLGVSPLVVQF